MPKRILNYSRTEPARTILGTVIVISVLMQLFTLLPGTGLLTAIPNLIIVGGLGIYGGWAVFKNNLRRMATAAFMWHSIWLLSALNHAFIYKTTLDLVWVPFFIVSLTLAIVYLALRFEYKKTLEAGDV